MIIHDLQVLHNVPFEEYLLMPGISYSTIKSEGKPFAITSKMQLGTDVDNYINEPASFIGNVKRVRPLADLLIKEIGILYKCVEKQVVVTCMMEFGGFVMKYKGRIDWKIRNLLIIDTKVAEDIEKTIYHFGYNHQIEGYCLPFEMKDGVILGVSPTSIDRDTGLNKVKRIAIACKSGWWEQQVGRLGRKINLTTIKK